MGRLAELAAERGLAMRPAQIARFTRRNMAIQLAYRLGEHTVGPLPRPRAVACTYFRNLRGLFLGEVEPYFQVAGETFSSTTWTTGRTGSARCRAFAWWTSTPRTT
ncbi:hypothetical protein ACFQ60_46660 [Streptomyces zhihengii]